MPDQMTAKCTRQKDGINNILSGSAEPRENKKQQQIYFIGSIQRKMDVTVYCCYCNVNFLCCHFIFIDSIGSAQCVTQHNTATHTELKHNIHSINICVEHGNLRQKQIKMPSFMSLNLMERLNWSRSRTELFFCCQVSMFVCVCVHWRERNVNLLCCIKLHIH